MPDSHFSSLDECRDKVENDPGLESLCWCTCCKDEKGRHDGCYCPACDTSKKAQGALMFDPTFRSPQKAFQPLLCPMELDVNDVSGCQFRVWNVEDEVDFDKIDQDTPTT